MEDEFVASRMRPGTIRSALRPRYALLLSLSVLVLLLAGCSAGSQGVDLEDQDRGPQETVRTYFTSWDAGDYQTMYDQFSDGFKALEPTSKTLTDFKGYASSQGIDGVSIISVEQRSNDGTKATVDYDVVFRTAQGEIPFDGTFTIKNKPGDSIPGWKMIHPYGDNIDTT